MLETWRLTVKVVILRVTEVSKMKKVRWLLFWLVLMLCVGYTLGPIGGCVKGWYTDPDTGEQTKYSYVDPNVADKVENAVEGAVGTMALLLPLLPWLAPFLAGGGVGLATWKKLKPQLTAANKEKSDVVRGGAILTDILEIIKIDYPDLWKKIGPKIHDASTASATVEAAIKEFRRSVSDV